MNYHVQITSLQTIHPALPPVLGTVDLNRDIPANTPMDPAHLSHAKAVADTLQATHDSGQAPAAVTADVVSTAHLRRVAIQNAQASALFFPVDLANQLIAINANLVAMNNSLNINNALIRNLAITGANRSADQTRAQTPVPYLPRQKENLGFGFALALAVANVGAQTNYINAQQNALNPPGNPGNPPAIGTIPIPFNDHPITLTINDVADLIIFYNDAFGIVNGDTLAEKRKKFMEWLKQPLA